MPSNPLTESLFDAIAAINQWFSKAMMPYVYVGGIAASIHGKPRLTQDVDALIIADDSELDSLVVSAKKWGIVPRVANAVSFAKKSHVLLMKHNPSATDVDVMVGVMPFEEAMVHHAVIIRIAKTTLRLPKPEDLIIMKIIAGRPKDLEDIRAILDAHPRINTARLRKTIAKLADATGDSQMTPLFNQLLK